MTAGERFRAALAEEKPLQVAGAINAYTARLAEATGFKALYLSGGGVAAGDGQPGKQFAGASAEDLCAISQCAAGTGAQRAGCVEKNSWNAAVCAVRMG